MKKVIISALTLAAMMVAPAHAISDKYRAQLERSGCTQLTDGNGCDIHKTKAQNAAAAAKNAPKAVATPALTAKQQYSQIIGEAESVLKMQSDTAKDYLVKKGWRHQSNGDWSKAGHQLRLVEEDGVVKNAQIVK